MLPRWPALWLCASLSIPAVAAAGGTYEPVAIGSDNLAFMTDDNGNKYLYTTFTEEQLNAAPAYDESTYAETRDEQRLMVQ